MTAARDHPLRGELHGEIHARPFTALYPPERISYIAMLSGEEGAAADRAWLAQLCSRFGVSAPQAGNHFYHDFGPFRLKWERHTEFCAYTIFLRARLQLRLQTMIEGISVVAASYYLLGLLAYVLDGTEKLGLPVDPEISAAVAVPVVVGAVWLVIRGVRRRLIGDGVDEDGA